MIILKLAFRNLARNRKSTLVLTGLVIVGVFVFVFGDSILGSATDGMSREFQNAYTGDIAIRSQFDRKFGIFGFSVPTIGEYEQMPTLTEASAIEAVLSANPRLGGHASLVSGAALLEGPGGYQIKVPVFGVDESTYFGFFPQLSFRAGSPATRDLPWIVLPKNRADELEKGGGKPLVIGESLQLTMASGSAFTIRAVQLVGIVDLPGRGIAEAAAVYTGAETLRGLLGLAGAKTVMPRGEGGAAPKMTSIESMFSVPDAEAAPSNDPAASVGMELAAQYLSDKSLSTARTDPKLGAWHFILARLAPGSRPGPAIRAINADLRKAGIPAEAVGWLSVAGLNAGVLFLLKSIFELGILVLSGVVVLVLANGLAFSVIEQTREIGSMRAMGAQRDFVRLMYFTQALVIVFAGAAMGILVSALILKSIGRAGIPLGNPYLVMLFGETLLKPRFLPQSAMLAIAGSIFVAAISAIYPMLLADRTTVAETMQAE